MSDFNVYIDEAGDLGYRRGTKWFVLTAVIAASRDEPKIRAAISQLKAKLNVHEIHFRKINNFFNKILTVQELARLPFTFISIVVDTDLLDEEMRSDSMTAYNYICSMLIESTVRYLREKGCTGSITLSARGTSRDNELIRYISQLIDDKNNNIAPDVITGITAKPAGSWDMLQMADVCAAAAFSRFQKNPQGFCVPCYTNVLSPHLYQRNGSVFGYGLKYFCEEMRPDPDMMMRAWPCAQCSK